MTATAGPDATGTARAQPDGRALDRAVGSRGRDLLEETGGRIARRNLLFSVLSEHIGFSIWTLWSVMVLFMGPEYGLDPAGKFLLISVATLVGAVVRVPYTFAVALFGGRNWTIVSALLLLVPTARRLRGDGARDLVHHVPGGRPRSPASAAATSPRP